MAFRAACLLNRQFACNVNFKPYFYGKIRTHMNLSSAELA